MATITFNGVFPVHGCKFEISTNGDVPAPTYAEPKDLESLNIQIDNNVETWTPLDQNGWQRAMSTGKGYTINVSGKRNLGDPGNDYIASKRFAMGRDCDTKYRITFPNDEVLSGGVVVSNTDDLGASTDVAALGCDLISNGKPTFSAGASAPAGSGS